MVFGEVAERKFGAPYLLPIVAICTPLWRA